MFCAHCGAKILEDWWSFCSTCGKPVNREQPLNAETCPEATPKPKADESPKDMRHWRPEGFVWRNQSYPVVYEHGGHESEESETAAKQMSFKCKGCGVVHTLGQDSVVARASSIIEDAPFVTDFGGGRNLSDTKRHPDIVARLPRSWNSLEPEEVVRHEADMAIIRSDLEAGKPRWYECYECKAVQKYKAM